MAISERPIGVKEYYRMFIQEYKQKLEETYKLREELEDNIQNKHRDITSLKDIYKTEFEIDLDKYVEFKTNRYSTGKFFRAANGLLINKKNDYELVYNLYALYELAAKQKELYDCENNIKLYTKCSKLTLKEYTEILRVYYTEVHKQIILEGKGYSISNGIGWICVNRCTIDRKKPMLDFAATKKRELELKREGKRIYNKEEADWCARNGIEYKAEDKRVFRTDEYCYQIPLIDCSFKHGYDYELTIADYRHTKLRGKTNQDLIELCNGDTTKICELPIDLKTKLTLCDKVDKILYTKFIRNENQKPIAFATIDRKNR